MLITTCFITIFHYRFLFPFSRHVIPPWLSVFPLLTPLIFEHFVCENILIADDAGVELHEFLVVHLDEFIDAIAQVDEVGHLLGDVFEVEVE